MWMAWPWSKRFEQKWMLTFSLANCGPLNAVLGRFSSLALAPFSIGGFFGRRVRGPAK